MRVIRYTIFIILAVATLASSQRPILNLTKAEVAEINGSLGSVPLFDQQLDVVRTQVNAAISEGIDVPIPVDMAGGYTHERHKENYKLMQKAGNLYQITGDATYAAYVKEMLMEYAEMYPAIGRHPTNKSYATGKIFWQCLNDANWLVFTSQAYDCIYDYLTESERRHLESDLFVPMADFLSIENPRFFNRIHNHSTWANAAVGMIALAMDNDTLLQKALHGMKDDGIDPNEVDNDGGYIKREGVYQAGFFAQLDYAFSPDGYFAEGPYYQRYAIFPFLAFSYALHNSKPELDIFNYRDGILIKATHALLLLTDGEGNFFPVNDAMKGMSYLAYELITAVDIIYSLDANDKLLLDWAALQDQVTLNGAGFITAKGLINHIPSIPAKISQNFNDGVDGTEGGVTVLRNGSLEVLFKYSTQGMGHGHFDRLSYGMYDDNGEVIQDYGAVRWVNVDQKAGGRYLPENKTFGKKTIGHNALVVNRQSHFDSRVREADDNHPDYWYSDFSDSQVHMVSAIEKNAYANTEMQRSLFLIDDDSSESTIMIDVVQATSEQTNNYDLPMWFTGQFLKGNVNCTKSLTTLSPLGEDDGYQHIWKESSCELTENNYQFNWLTNLRFYSATFVAEEGDQVILGRNGANDPNFNLRPDPVIIQRRDGVKSTTFLTMVESHGHYSTVTEIPINPYPKYRNLVLDYNEDGYVMCSFESDDTMWQLRYCSNSNDKTKQHKIKVDGESYQWTGVYQLTKNSK